MLSLPASAALGLVLATTLATGCSGDPEETSVEVEGFVVACRDDTCVNLPAAGASVRLAGDGGTVVEGTLDNRGVFESDIEPGAYDVELAVDELGLRRRPGGDVEITVAEGEVGSVTIWLPNVQVRQTR